MARFSQASPSGGCQSTCAPVGAAGGHDHRVVGEDIVLIDTATRLILDVMKGILR